jgi:hypothetical protein
MFRPSLAVLATIVFFLAACGSSSGPQPGSSTTDSAISTEAQLILGTLKLDDTELAVTAGQADELLVMWQVYLELSSSSTAAQAEIDGLVDQIQELMTAEQMDSISVMDFTQQDIFALMQEGGAATGQVRQASNSSAQSGSGFASPDSGMAGGGPPPDSGMAGNAPPDGGVGETGSAGSSVSTNQSQATEAAKGVGSSAGIPAALVDALIQYLEQIASA